MRLTTKDTFGLVLVAGTFAALAIHNEPTHRATHLPTVVDAGGAITDPASLRTFAFVDFNVIPMLDDAVAQHQVVIVEDGFVRAIGALGSVEVPTDAGVIDGEGRAYLVPGLTDAHIHLRDAPEDWLPLLITNGVTTAFNLEGDARHLALSERILNEDAIGPTLYTAGPFITLDVVPSVAAARRTVEGQASRGYDFVKIHGELPADVYEAVTTRARELKIPVVGHAPRDLPFSAVLESGQIGVSHAEELIYTDFMSLDPSGLDDVAAAMAAAGVWLTPTLANFASKTAQWGTADALEAGLSDELAQYLPASLRREWEEFSAYSERDPRERQRLAEMNEFHTPLIRAAYEAGVSLLAGTDTPLPMMWPGFSLHDELAAMERAGLPRFDVLASATRNPGRFIQEQVDGSSMFGTIQVGARADMLVANGNPLDDLAFLRQPQGVMVRGRWYDRAGLELLLTQASGMRMAVTESR